MSSQKVRNICFTLNNYTDEELTSIEAALSDETEVAYAVYGRETAPETGYCEFKDPTGVFILKPSKKDDMAYMVPEDPPLRVVFMDCARSATEFLQYSFLEDLKDGRVSCPKYESFIKFLPPIHVVVLMNQEPDMTKLSEDRYDIRFISVDENDPPIPRRVLPANAPGFNPGP